MGAQPLQKPLPARAFAVLLGRVNQIKEAHHFWVWMLKMSENNWYHSGNVLDVINILSNLRESHESSVLVSPVSIILKGLVNDDTEEW